MKNESSRTIHVILVNIWFGVANCTVAPAFACAIKIINLFLFEL